MIGFGFVRSDLHKVMKITHICKRLVRCHLLTLGPVEVMLRFFVEISPFARCPQPSTVGLLLITEERNLYVYIFHSITFNVVPIEKQMIF